MNDTTRAAVLALAAALANDKAGAKELKCYGNIPMHLADLVADLEIDDEDE